MKSSIVAFNLVIGGLFFMSCNGLDKNELRHYVEDENNGLTQKQVFSEVDYKIMFRPNDLAYVYEAANDPLTSSDLKKYQEENKNVSLFILEINLTDSVKKSVSDFNPIKSTYQNTLNANLFELKEGSEEIPCIIYHCETKGKGHYLINLIFGKGVIDIQNDWILNFFDPVTGSTPKFIFKKEQLTQVPSLTI